MKDPLDLKIALLCFEAKRWLGTLEHGQNKGEIVSMFQRAVDNQAREESWCMAFAQYCIKMVNATFEELFPEHHSPPSSLFRSEHCLTVWNKSPHLQTQEPSKGALCIWQRFDEQGATAQGHVGIIIQVHDNGAISIIEGNSPGPDGEGVRLRQVPLGRLNHGSLVLKGFLQAWK